MRLIGRSEVSSSSKEMLECSGICAIRGLEKEEVILTDEGCVGGRIAD